MNKFPIHMQIEVTNCCQLACLMCPNSSMKRPKGFMSLDTLQRILAETGERTTTCYMHQFGEPLLHPELCKMIQMTEASGIRTSLSTNAVALTPELAHGLYSSGLGEIIISFDSLRKDVYEKYRVGANFEHVLNNINSAIHVRKENPAFRTEVALQMVVMKDTQADVAAFKEYFGPALEGIGHLRFMPYATWAGSVPDFSPTKATPWRNRCKTLIQSICVYWNGDIVLCCHDYDGATKVGNIHETTIESIYNGAVYTKLREDQKANNGIMTHPFCKDC